MTDEIIKTNNACELPYYETKFREYLKRYHPDKYDQLIFNEARN